MVSLRNRQSIPRPKYTYDDDDYDIDNNDQGGGEIDKRHRMEIVSVDSSTEDEYHLEDEDDEESNHSSDDESLEVNEISDDEGDESGVSNIDDDEHDRKGAKKRVFKSSSSSSRVPKEKASKTPKNAKVAPVMIEDDLDDAVILLQGQTKDIQEQSDKEAVVKLAGSLGTRTDSDKQTPDFFHRDDSSPIGLEESPKQEKDVDPNLVLLTTVAMNFLRSEYKAKTLPLLPVRLRKMDSPAVSDEEARNLLHVKKSPDGKFGCLVPGCAKTFKVQGSIKYHIEHTEHSVMPLFKHVFCNEDNYQRVEELAQKFSLPIDLIPRTESSLQELAESNLGASFKLSPMMYLWPGLKALCECELIFAVETYPTGDTETSLKDDNSYSAASSRRSRTVYKGGSLFPSPKGLLNNYSTELFASLRPTLGSIQSVTDEYAKRFHQKLFPVPFYVSVGKNSNGAMHAVEYCSAEKVEGSHTSILNVGGTVLATEWVPTAANAKDERFLAVAGSNDFAPVIMFDRGNNGPTCIMIWRVPRDGVPTIAYRICGDYGHVRGIKFCPFGCYDDPENYTGGIPRLGLMAVICGDGSFRVFSLPHPVAIQGTNTRITPCFEDKLPESSFSSIFWSRDSQCSRIVCGSSCGAIHVYSVRDRIGVQKLMCFQAHHSPVSDAVLINNSAFDLVSNGLDGKLCYTDLRFPCNVSCLETVRVWTPLCTNQTGSQLFFMPGGVNLRMTDVSNLTANYKIGVFKSCLHAIDVRVRTEVEQEGVLALANGTVELIRIGPGTSRNSTYTAYSKPWIKLIPRKVEANKKDGINDVVDGANESKYRMDLIVSSPGLGFTKVSPTAKPSLEFNAFECQIQTTSITEGYVAAGAHCGLVFVARL